MRVTSNSYPNALIDQFQKLAERQLEFHNQISTGQRVTLPSDDPKAMNRILENQADKRQLVQFRRNHTIAETLVQVGHQGWDNIFDLNVRSQEIAIATGDTSSPAEMSAYAQEVNQLLEQALQVANTTVNGNYIYGGDQTDTQAFSETRDVNGKITSVSYVGSVTAPSFFVGEGTQISPYTDPASNVNINDFITHLISLRDALETANLPAIATARTNLAGAEDTMLIAISDLGAKQLRLDITKAKDDARYSSLDMQISQDADIDLAQVIVKLNLAQSAYHAALQSGARILKQSLLDFV